nr:3'(2'),5'-bisphosphate nucleotidase CysQ [Saprospiraceae bacterium]
MPRTDTKAFLDPVIELCEEVMTEVLSMYHRDEEWNVQTKKDGSPLTQADLLANELIVRRLRELSPEIPILSEEMINPPFSERQNFQSLWMVDPIDGTYGFINRTGDFSINIALIRDQSPVLGVVGMPVTGEIYYATSGGGAFVRMGDRTKALEAEVFSKEDRGLRFVCSPKQDSDVMTRYFSKFTDPVVKYRGGTVKFLMVARGEAHIYPNNRLINEWDTAAGHLIVEESGGVVLQADNDQPIKYNKTELRNPPFIVYGDVKEIG